MVGTGIKPVKHLLIYLPPSSLVHDLTCQLHGCLPRTIGYVQELSNTTNCKTDLLPSCHTIVLHGGWLHRRSSKLTVRNGKGVHARKWALAEGNPKRFNTSDKIIASACYITKCRVWDSWWFWYTIGSRVNHDGPNLQNL